MVVDTSALVAVILQEPDAARVARAIRRAAAVQLSAVALVEATMVLLPRIGEGGVQRLDAFVEEIGMGVAPVTRDTAQLAREAFRRFGKGRHPAALNFGDCFSYALAVALQESLPFVGDDCARTDVPAAAY